MSNLALVTPERSAFVDALAIRSLAEERDSVVILLGVSVEQHP